MSGDPAQVRPRHNLSLWRWTVQQCDENVNNDNDADAGDVSASRRRRHDKNVFSLIGFKLIHVQILFGGLEKFKL